MKISKFLVESSKAYSLNNDVAIKHKLFPELVEIVYGHKDPSQCITPEKEYRLDQMISDQYFFRYWLSERVAPSVYTGKSTFLRRNPPYESLIEDYMNEFETNLSKQNVFSLLYSQDSKKVEFNEPFGSNSAYDCVKIAK